MSEWIANSFGVKPCHIGVRVMVEFGDGSVSNGLVDDFYWKIDGDSSDIVRWKLIGNQAETQEEKEAFEAMGGVEWRNGDECRYENDITHEYTYIGKHPNTDGHYVFSEEKGITFVRDAYLSKPETPEQKAERERLEAIEDLQEWIKDGFANSATAYEIAYDIYEAGYRKAK